MDHHGDSLRILSLVGPTASGKSDLAVRVAARLPLSVEIVSCDAFQVYRELDIGSAKPPLPERQEPPHHLLDVLDPDDACSAGRYAGLAAAAIRGIAGRGSVPFVVGGSGLYFRALRDGIFESPRLDRRLRARLLGIYQRPAGTRWLEALLRRLDPAAHRRIHPNDRVRRVRALEVVLTTGEPISRLQATRRPPLAEARWSVAALAPPRPALDRRIEDRVSAMFDQGLVEEVRRLEARYRTSWPGRLAIGYREVSEALAGDPGPAELRRRLQEARTRIAAATRRYARRQITWFRAESGVTWHAGSAADPVVEESLARQFGRFLGGPAQEKVRESPVPIPGRLAAPGGRS